MPLLPVAAAVLASVPGPGTGSVAGYDGTTLVVVAGLGLFVAWAVSLLLHPYTACSSCKGNPRSFGAIATRSFRLCGACGGSGRRLRVGARMWPHNRG